MAQAESAQPVELTAEAMERRGSLGSSREFQSPRLPWDEAHGLAKAHFISFGSKRGSKRGDSASFRGVLLGFRA